MFFSPCNANYGGEKDGRNLYNLEKAKLLKLKGDGAKLRAATDEFWMAASYKTGTERW